MKQPFEDNEMDTLNRYIDDMLSPEERATFEQSLAQSPRLADMLHHLQDATDQLHRAFGPRDAASSDAVAAVMNQIDGASDRHDGAEQEQDTEPLGFVGRAPLWRQAIAVAACAAVVATALFAGRLVSPFSGATETGLPQLYTQMVDHGFVAPQSCSPERFTEEMQEITGQPLLLAALPGGVTLSGWSYPSFYGGQLTDEKELVLLGRVDGHPVMILLHPAGSPAPERQDQPGVFVHRRALGQLVGYEVGPFETPRLINLLSTPQ